MGKRRSIEEKLGALRELAAQEANDDTLDEIRRALADKNNLVVAKAAGIVAEQEIAGVADDLVAAFDRFLINPVRSDKGCSAKTAVADALYHVAHGDEEVFLRGIRHVHFQDDNFLMHRKWLAEFLHLFPRISRDLTWSCAGRIDLVVDRH